MLKHLIAIGFIYWLLPVSAQVPVHGFKVINTYPHDPQAFTQGLVFEDGYLYEGTGRNGQSRLSKIRLEDGAVEMTTRLSDRYFGEGIEIVGDKIFQLTWQSHMVFVYNKEDFSPAGNHFNPGEGWGLAWNGEQLILSDGTSTLHFLDPDTFAPTGRIRVTLEGEPVDRLNELEYINGEIWANVWQTDYIVRIDPSSGQVNSIVNLQGLTAITSRPGNDAVLNGIAYDDDTGRLFVTGKLWPSLYEIELVEP
ncbi:MAG: hypothetical protein RLZZ385_1727 [Pseudomonadota bacterium]|jgi:glutamine cyclotransferase